MGVSLRSGTTCDWVERSLYSRPRPWLDHPSTCRSAGGSAAVCVGGVWVCVCVCVWGEGH